MIYVLCCRRAEFEYNVVRTDTADAGLRKIVLYIAQNFGNDVALKKLDEIEDRIRQLGENPDLGIDPRYLVLKRQGSIRY